MVLCSTVADPVHLHHLHHINRLEMGCSFLFLPLVVLCTFPRCRCGSHAHCWSTTAPTGSTTSCLPAHRCASLHHQHQHAVLSVCQLTAPPHHQQVQLGSTTSCLQAHRCASLHHKTNMQCFLFVSSPLYSFPVTSPAI